MDVCESYVSLLTVVFDPALISLATALRSPFFLVFIFVGVTRPSIAQLVALQTLKPTYLGSILSPSLKPTCVSSIPFAVLRMKL